MVRASRVRRASRRCTRGRRHRAAADHAGTFDAARALDEERTRASWQPVRSPRRPTTKGVRTTSLQEALAGAAEARRCRAMRPKRGPGASDRSAGNTHWSATSSAFAFFGAALEACTANVRINIASCATRTVRRAGQNVWPHLDRGAKRLAGAAPVRALGSRWRARHRRRRQLPGGATYRAARGRRMHRDAAASPAS